MDSLVSLLTGHPYLLLVLLVFIEGPLAMVSAGVLIAGGVMYWPLAVLLAVCADMTADNAYYLLGRNARHPRVSRLLARFGLTENRFEKVEKMFRRNDTEALIGAKVADFAAIPVLLTAGLTKMRYSRFMTVNAATTLARTSLLIAAGSIAGHQILALADDVGFAAGAVAALVFASLFALTSASKRYWKRSRP